MPNNAYLRGRKLEWAVQKLFKEAGYLAMRTAGSHGFADVIVTRPPDEGLALAMNRPITICDIDEVLDGWMEVADRELIINGYLYGRRKFLARGGEQFIHMTPVQAWMFQMKTKKGK